jgi:uncharacterized repeat protein (TIGR03803 family)
MKLIVKTPGKLNWGMRACAVFVLCAAAAIALPAQTFSTLVNFNGTNGSYPYDVTLAQGTDGNLYGVTDGGGVNGYGTIFKMTTAGALTTLYNFASTDGASPYAGLILATDGNFYGTTNYGGAYDSGTIFRISAEGTLTTLHSFSGADGFGPQASLIQATDGNFYGATSWGGTTSCINIDGQGCGTVFKITPAGALTVLHNFKGTDGAQPRCALVQGTDGNFYGTTVLGGSKGYGTVFEVTSSGAFTTVYNFCSRANCVDGANPEAGLILGTDGKFYGTTDQGGKGHEGTVFSLTPGGKLTIFYHFSFGMTLGQPEAGLVQATDGSFYGATLAAIFRVSGIGKGAVVYSPIQGPITGALVQATDGNLYGAEALGGANSLGTVFSLSTGLGPFVKALPAVGQTGAAVSILGTDLAGATSVTFNGTSAAFSVASPTLITTTVPAGATTGSIQVVTPSGTLSSNVPFRVPQKAATFAH